MDFLKKYAVKIAAGILFVFFLLSLVLAWQEAAIYDERAHIPAAYTYLDRGDMRLNPEHPPLLKNLAGFPLLFLNVNFPYAAPAWEESGTEGQWALGDAFLHQNDADAILFWSRFPLIFIALLLGLMIFLWTRELAGSVAGLFALTLYAADPNIIAHSHYVTTDIGIAAFIFFAFYFFVRFLKKPTLYNLLLAGIFLGLAQLTKFSAVLLFPIFALFVVLYALTTPTLAHGVGSRAVLKLRVLWEYLWKYAGVVVICFGLIWILYFLNTVNMPGEKIMAVADIKLSQPNPFATFAYNLVESTSQVPWLKPLSVYFLGVAMVFGRVAGGNVYYFLGSVSSTATPWYFPVVFLLKETLPFLFLLFATTAYGAWRVGARLLHDRTSSMLSVFSRSFQKNITWYLSVFFIVFYSLVSMGGNLTIGFRHLLPILPFLYMLIAKTVFEALRRLRDTPTYTMLTWLLGGLTLFIIAIPILAYPGYLSYFNPVGGGNVNGYRYVTDSNYDWGQDLKRLRTFVTSYNRCVAGLAPPTDPCKLAKKSYPPIEKIRVDYFGGSNPVYYLGERFIPWWDKRAPEPGWYAISSFFYQESIYKPKAPSEPDYSWLQAFQPVARAGDSIFIYYIAPEDLPAR